MVIILLVVVFDPLAVVLLIAANHGMSQTKQLTNIENTSILIIDENIFGEAHVIERTTNQELNNRTDRNSFGVEDLFKEGYDTHNSPNDQRSIERIS
jgi:hypothetical protein